MGISTFIQSVYPSFSSRREGTKAPLPGFGTFKGVYLPSILTIFGVIMYLRLGWIVGAIGLPWTLFVIVLACSITLITAISIAAAATNMHVKGGGAYFIISRSFGKEIGSAVGVPLFLAQTIGTAFYIVGFSECIHSLLPMLPMKAIGLLVLGVITLLSYLSADLALRTQFFIFLLIIGSLASFFSGGEVAVELGSEGPPAEGVGLWGAFALFFPAVTGIEAGVSLSGDLRKPSRSLPLGTIAAVLTGLVVYLMIAYVMGTHVPRYVLLTDTMIVQHMAKWPALIVLGLLGATLSSALGAMLGAPRTLQALAQDGIVPRFLGKGYGKTQEPRIATLVASAITGLCVAAGNIDLIAPVLTMFFLISYGMLNIATGFESLMKNPSWRPTLRIPAPISIGGAILCLMTMLMIDAGATFIALFFVFLLYVWLHKRRLTADWDDIRQGILFFFSRFAVYRLAGCAPSPRSWRPNFLVLTDSFSAPDSLLTFTSSITNDKGFLTVASICSDIKDQLNLDTIKKRLSEVLKKKRIQALVRVTQEGDVVGNMERLINSYGLGPLTPNTVVLAEIATLEDADRTARLIKLAHARQKNMVVIRGDDAGVVPVGEKGQQHEIDVWWDDEAKDNSELMLVLAHMHQSARSHYPIKINVKCLVTSEAAREQRHAYFVDFFARSRLKIDAHVYVAADDEPLEKLIKYFSAKAGMTFIGLRPPFDDESLEDYTVYYRNLLRGHRSLTAVAYVLAGERVELEKIFC